ncbi:MAG: hypothetical protein JW860_06820 [Sedimentisphaerales bacterium]|nr:hypothetical protein [Sedimentisphaerales bacterium]
MKRNIQALFPLKSKSCMHQIYGCVLIWEDLWNSARKSQKNITIPDFPSHGASAGADATNVGFSHENGQAGIPDDGRMIRTSPDSNRRLPRRDHLP